MLLLNERAIKLSAKQYCHDARSNVFLFTQLSFEKMVAIVVAFLHLHFIYSFAVVFSQCDRSSIMKIWLFPWCNLKSAKAKSRFKDPLRELQEYSNMVSLLQKSYTYLSWNISCALRFFHSFFLFFNSVIFFLISVDFLDFSWNTIWSL